MNIGDAASAGDLSLVRTLIEVGGVSVDIQDLQGFTPLMRACQRHQDEVVEYLLQQGADPTLQNYAGRTARDLAREALNGSEYWKRDAKTFPLLEAALVQKYLNMEESVRQDIVAEIEKGAPLQNSIRKRPSIKFD